MISVTKVLFFAVIASAQDAGADRKLKAPRALESNLAASVMADMRQLEDSVMASMRQLNVELDADVRRSLCHTQPGGVCRELSEEDQRKLDERVMANVTSAMTTMRQLMDASETRVRQLFGRDGDVARSLDTIL